MFLVKCPYRGTEVSDRVPPCTAVSPKRRGRPRNHGCYICSEIAI